LGPALFIVLAELAREERRIPFRELTILGISILVGLAPIYLRDWIETGNPLFPMFSRVFPSPWVTLSWAEHFSSVHPDESVNRLHVIWVRLRELIRESPLVFGWLLVPTALVFPRTRELLRPWTEWFCVSFLSLGIFIMAFSLDAEIRYLGPTLVLLTICGLLAIRAGVAELPRRGRKVAVWIMLLSILAASKLPTHLLWKFPRIAPGEAFLQTHTAGDSKAWLRAHVPSGALVVMIGDNESYYLLGMRVTVLTERPDLDQATKGVTDLHAFVRSLCSLSGATFLLESRRELGMEKRFPTVNFQSSVAFQGVSSRVYDLPKLEAAVNPGEPPSCGKNPAPVYGVSVSSIR
jgi:hypothetical protein